jgi:hypothetical protein
VKLISELLKIYLVVLACHLLTPAYAGSYKDFFTYIDSDRAQEIEILLAKGFDPNTVNDPTKKEINMSSDDKKLLGMAIGVFITILLVAIVLWIISVVLLVKYWDRLTDAAKIIGVIGILPFVPAGPIFTIFAVIIGRKA